MGRGRRTQPIQGMWSSFLLQATSSVSPMLPEKGAMGRWERAGQEHCLGFLGRGSRAGTPHCRAGKAGTSGHIWSPARCPQPRGQMVQRYRGLDGVSRRVCWCLAGGYCDSHIRYQESFSHHSKMCQSPSLAVEHRSAFDSALTVHTACQLCHCSKD